MHRLFTTALLALALVGCGESGDPSDAKRTAATPSEADHTGHAHNLDGYSEGVKRYYGTDHHPEAAPGTNEDVESEYHQPPKPAQAGLGDTITLTGANIGVRMDVTVTDVKRVSKYTAVEVELDSTGITNYEGPLASASVTYPGSKPRPATTDTSADCSNDFAEPTVFIPVGGKAKGCLLFPSSGSKTPERFQLALETVPAEAGGIWELG